MSRKTNFLNTVFFPLSFEVFIKPKTIISRYLIPPPGHEVCLLSYRTPRMLLNSMIIKKHQSKTWSFHRELGAIIFWLLNDIFLVPWTTTKIFYLNDRLYFLNAALPAEVQINLTFKCKLQKVREARTIHMKLYQT